MMARRRQETQPERQVRLSDPIQPPGLRAGVHARDQGSANQELTESVLVRFDRKTRVFLGFLLFFLALGTLFRLNGSSVAYWNGIFPDRSPDAGVLLGTPKRIRSDEWSVTTPMMISQAMSRPPFPISNPSWGPAQVPLIFSLPVRHWSALVRPQYWAFFTLDLEHAFAFYWSMKAVILLGGVFLLLMLLTGNDFEVSLLGATWVFFSGFMQWWYSTPAMMPEMVGYVGLLLVATHYVALSSRRWVIGASALVFLLCLFNCALLLYPPFQVPLFYLGITVLAGSLGPRLVSGSPPGHLAFRAGCAAIAMSSVAVLLALYYRDAKQAIELMRGTIYPGSRTSLGGEVSLAQVFAGFYGFFMSQESFPQKWLNVCEASNFVLLFPVPMAAVLWRAWRRQGVTALEWSLIIYLVVVLAWMTVGFPRGLAVASAFGLSEGSRSLIGLGLASIFLCCVFLAKSGIDLPSSLSGRLVIAASLLTILVVFALDFNRVTEGFATLDQIALVSLVGAASAYLLLARKRITLAVCVLLPSIWSYGLVNPVAVGLGPILDTRLFREVSRILDQDPHARWAVYGGAIVANLLKAVGAPVFNGTKVVPPLEDFRVIDPQSLGAWIYNRYGYIFLLPAEGAQVTLRLVQTVPPDAYAIKIDPKSDLWRRLGIRYVVLPFAVTDPEFLGRTALMVALPDVGLWIYRYQWGISPRNSNPS